jgi:hypothetical protein
MSKDYKGAQQGAMGEGLKETITQLGLEYRLLTQFTSFVAVEEMMVTDGGQPRRVEVPVELPEGVSNNAIGDTADVEYSVNTGPTNFSTTTSTRQVKELPVQARNSPQSLATLSPSVTGNGRGAAGKTKDGEKSERKRSSTFIVDGVNTTDEAAKVDAAKVNNEKPTPEQQRQQEIVAKMHPSVVAILSRLISKGTQPTADEQRFVTDGKAEIQVWLFDKTPEALEELKQLGFEVSLDPKTSKLVIGRIAIEQLSALAELKSVRYIAPQIKRS